METTKFGGVVLSRKPYHGYGNKEVYCGGYGEKKDVSGRYGYRRREKSYGNGSRRSKGTTEPREISSGRWSDGSVASGLVDDGRDIEVGLPPRKKRKFSLEKEKTNSTKHPHQSPKVVSLPRSSTLIHGEVEQLEEDGFNPEKNVTVSRWADFEEGECNEDMHVKGNHSSDSSLTSLGSKKSSPEVEEFSSVDGRESECDLHLNRIEDGGANNVYDKNMCYGSDIDLEEENEYVGTPESVRPQQTNMLDGSRSVHDFERLKKIGAGTYGVVYQCRDKTNGEIVALKKIKVDRETEGFPMSSLREINILTSLRHPSIVEVKEVVVEEADKYERSGTYLVMEYMEHDLKGLMETMKEPFSQSEVKCLMLQLLEGVNYLHDNWVVHRDLKTSNILLNNCGELKICDFGMSRQYGSPLKPYTPLVVTLWYRAPELLLGAKQYSTAIDMWSLGCIMAELLTKKPLFCGESEIDQLNKIFKTLGTPTETNWPGFSKLPGFKFNFVRQKNNLLHEIFPPRSFIASPRLTAAGLDLLDRLLTCDPEKRITAAEAVNHEWFREKNMPTFPVQHDKTRRHRDDGETFSLVIYFTCRMALSFGVDLTVCTFCMPKRWLKAKRDFTSILFWTVLMQCYTKVADYCPCGRY